MERSRETYWRVHPNTSPFKLVWRALTVRHSFHVLPGETILELGAGSGYWTEHLAAVLRGEHPITAAVFNAQSVTWTIIGGGVTGTIDASGLYIPPATIPNPATVTITATSSAATVPGSAYVTVAPATPLGTSHVMVTATAMGDVPHADVVTLIVR
jgi:predicted methyltransferase